MNVAALRRVLETRTHKVTCILLFGVIASASPALAQPMAADSAVDTTVEAPPPKGAPYSLPFQLRPAAAGTVVRLDNALAFYSDPTTKKAGTTYVPLLLFSYKLTDNLAPLVRVGVVDNSAPKGTSGFGLLNPVLGATYALKLRPELRLAFFLGVALPVGSGGGNDPNADRKLARNAGILARSAMDNAMFAVNDFVVFPGVDFAFVSHGFTAQVEATVLELTRVRGERDQPDKHRTNLTAGLHLGYFFIPELSAAVELRHQRWLSTPKAIEADKTDTLRDTTTLAFGPRVHIQLAKDVWLRPSLALVLPLDAPMTKSSYKVVQLDLPVSF